MNKWKKIAFTDMSLGIKNRNYYEYYLKHKKRYEGVIGFIDVNDLKLINDNQGHKYGDDLMYELAQALDNFDIAFRYGGDEFVIVSSSLSDTEMKDKLEELKEKYNISYGICRKGQYDLWRQAIEIADKEMYEMKCKYKESLVEEK